MAIRVDPDQTAPKEAVRSGSTLFTYAILLEFNLTSLHICKVWSEHPLIVQNMEEQIQKRLLQQVCWIREVDILIKI